MMRHRIPLLALVAVFFVACQSGSVSCLEHETALSRNSSDLGGRIEPTFAVHCYDSSGKLISIDGQPINR